MTWTGYPWCFRRFRVSYEITDDRFCDVVLSTPEKVVEFCKGLIYCPQEVLLWIAVDSRKRIVAVDEMFKGTADACMVEPREVFRAALLLAPTVTGIFCVHNHPSGNPEPSDADIEAMDRIHAAGELLRIPLIDGVIVSQRGAWSRSGGYIRVPESYSRPLEAEQ